AQSLLAQSGERYLTTGSQVVDFALSGAEKFRGLVDLDFAEQVIGRDLDAGVSEQRDLLREFAAAPVAIGFAVRPHLTRVRPGSSRRVRAPRLRRWRASSRSRCATGASGPPRVRVSRPIRSTASRALRVRRPA